MKLYLSIILISMTTTHATASLLTLNNGDLQQEIQIKPFQGLKVNQKCIDLNDKCMALLSTKIKLIVKQTKIAGHPASKVCQAKGGYSIILKDNKKNEYDYCTFSDGSMVSSWDLEKTK